jgi:hypothetical protein
MHVRWPVQDNDCENMRRENMHFAIVNRAWTTSKTPAGLLIIHFVCAMGLM